MARPGRSVCQCGDCADTGLTLGEFGVLILIVLFFAASTNGGLLFHTWSHMVWVNRLGQGGSTYLEQR